MSARGDAGFPKSVRLRRPAEFRAMKRHGMRLHLASFVVIHRVSPAGVTRLGVSVSKRVGRSVIRNRLKRLIREVFRTSRRDAPVAQDVLVIARASANNLNYAQVAAELGRVFQSSSASR